ncbi:SDR family oxidoreductase [bacterium]|nr:SDR family oxidoreductase [bacterium]
MIKTAVITGAGSGIGQAIAIRLAEDDCRIVILENDEDAAQSTVQLIGQSGGKADVIVCDVADFDSVNDSFAQINRVDVLVNNAGIAAVGNVEQTTPEQFDAIYNVNVKGVYHCLHFGIPKMVTGGGGAILNLASIASKVGISDRFAYSMSKGAVLTMTLSVARDYIDKGIRANCICPARVHTPFVDGYLENNYTEEERPEMFEKLSEFQPIGRMGKPSEIAELASFLCSEKSSFITASAYDIDGGVTLLR